MSQYIISLIRTWVPLAIGWALSKLVVLGVVLDSDASTNLKTSVTLLVIALYYAIARWLEQKFPRVGILLGYIRQPIYADPTKTPSQQKVDLAQQITDVAKTPKTNKDVTVVVSGNGGQSGISTPG